MSNYSSDSLFMQIAIDYAWNFQILTLPNPAVGALILWNNKIIALQAHRKANTPHAEVLACKDAFLYLLQNDQNTQAKITDTLKDVEDFKQKDVIKHLQYLLKSINDSALLHDFIEKYHNNIFSECEFFITLEPCNHYGKTPPCAKLLKTIAPKRIIIGHKDETPNAMGGTKTLSNIHITQNILQQEAKNLIYPFLQLQANNENFTLFKIAHRLNGDYQNGVISNHESRIFTHNMRCIADYIIISGETLRNDNPLLDTRFALPFYKENAKESKIIILTKTLSQEDLKHFRVANKDASIIDCISKIPKDGIKIIEGGFNFLHSLLHTSSPLEIDCIMGYIAPILSQANPHFNQDEYNNQNILKNFYLAHTLILEDFWTQQDLQYSNDKENKNILYYLFPKKSIKS